MNENTLFPEREPLSGAGTPPPEAESPLRRAFQANTGYLLRCGGVCAAACALLFCRAETGINVLLYVLVWLVCLRLALTRLGLRLGRKNVPLCAGLVLLALSSCLSSNRFIQSVNAVGVVLLMALLVLRCFCDTAAWQFGKHASAFFTLLFASLGKLAEPVRELLRRRETREKPRPVLRYVLLGLLIALPLLWLVLVLLVSADAVFLSMVERWMDGLLSLPRHVTAGLKTALEALLLLALGFAGLYGALSSQAQKPVDSAVPAGKRYPPLVAVTFTGLLAALYVVFCGVQVVYLFAGRQSGLPYGYTYAEYARQGFFQLLFVSALNAALVVFCRWKFQPSRLLRAVLTLLGACTYVLIASSAYRMLLYVDAYGLTFLRILVLWFLGVLAILLAGVTSSLYRPRFPLFRFTLAVCLALWLCFAFARPDALAARYNLEHFGLDDDLAGELIDLGSRSWDAAPLMAELDYQGWLSVEWDAFLEYQVPSSLESHGLRGFNLAVWQAARAADR